MSNSPMRDVAGLGPAACSNLLAIAPVAGELVLGAYCIHKMQTFDRSKQSLIGSKSKLKDDSLDGQCVNRC
jgi:hypothetical protein